MTDMQGRTARGLHVMLVAGEPSGDVLGGSLMRALQEARPNGLRFSGVGGEAMGAAGLSSLFPMQELSLMGLAEVLPKVPLLRRRLRETEDHALASSPDVIVTIDSPGFNFRLAKRLRRMGVPLVHYVAPQVWAWRPHRAKVIAEFLDHLLVLLPFEPPLFESAGLACTFVGHPVIESGASEGDGRAFRSRTGIPPEAQLLCVLPGSRHSETSRLLQPFGAAVALLRAEIPDLHVVVPTVPGVASEVAAATDTWGPNVHLLRGVGKFDAFAASDAALAASGTVGLELALAGVPTAVAYRMHPLTWQVARRVVRTPFVNLVNVLLSRRVVPELLQECCQPHILATTVHGLLTNPHIRTEQAAAAAQVAGMLTPPEGSPSRAAARAVLDVVEARRQGAAA